jgi:hypothetical protein
MQMQMQMQIQKQMPMQIQTKMRWAWSSGVHCLDQWVWNLPGRSVQQCLA